MADLPAHPGETAKAAAAFAAYARLGSDRSLAKLAQHLYGDEGKRRGKVVLLERWSAQYAWVARAAAYDAAVRAEEEAIAVKAKAAAAKRKAERLARMEARREKAEDDRIQIFNAEWATVLKRINAHLDADDMHGIVGMTALLKLALDEEWQRLGGATQSIAISGPDGGPMQVEVTDVRADLERRLARIALTSGQSGISSEPPG